MSDRTPVARAATFAKAVVALRASAPPRAAMLRSGGAIGVGFVVFLALGSPEQAVVCAFFTNFLCLADKATDLPTRVWVQLLGALLGAGAGAIGILVAGSPPMILLTTFVVALIAGFVHGTTPGVEAIPRYALVCLVVSAFLPVGNIDILLALALGTVLSLVAVVLDDHIRHGRRGIRVARLRAALTYPGPRFSLVYGLATVASLGLGLAFIGTRPYWVALTTILVMQPDRRANTIRVAQRFLGTLAGVVAAFLVVLVVPASARSHALVLLAVALPFVWPLGFDRNYGLGVAILSTWVLVLIDIALPPGELVGPLFLARLSNTSIGCAMALAGSFVVYETNAEIADEASQA